MISKQLIYVLALIDVPEVHTDLLWDLSILFGILGGLYFVFIFFTRNKFSRSRISLLQRRSELAPMISKFLFFEEDASEEETKDYIALKIEIRELLKEQANRKVLADILLDLQKDISGNARLRLNKLYKNLGLHLDAFNKLRSWKWQEVSKGILELTQMQVEEAYGFIKNRINDKRSIIRKQAELATITLKKEGIVYFLDTTTHRISEWQQIKMLDILRTLEDFEPPRFKAWLTSVNGDVVLFALRLIKFYKQDDSYASITELVKHKDQEIKLEALHCIREFQISNSKDTLKAVFWKNPAGIKLVILDTLGQLGSEEDLKFLHQVADREKSFNIKSKAYGAINKIAPETVLPFEDIESTIEDTQFLDENNWEEQREFNNDFSVEDQWPWDKEEMITAGDPYSWEDLLDPEQENEDIFDICMLEELQDMLAESGDDEDDKLEKEYLPLDFLPIVEPHENLTDVASQIDIQKEELMHLDVEAENVLEETEFHDELERLIDKIKEPVAVEEEKDDSLLNIEFLPFVTSKEDNEDMIDSEKELKSSGDEEASDNGGNNGGDDDFHNNNSMDPFEETQFQLEFDNNEDQEEEYDTEEVKNMQNEEVAFEFSDPKSDSHTEEETEEELVYSTFETLFERADTDSKLFLLDEVLEVGNEKEIPILKILAQDKNKHVRRKAIMVYEELNARIHAIDVEMDEVVGESRELKEDDAEEYLEEAVTRDLEYCFLEEIEDKVEAGEDDEMLFELGSWEEEKEDFLPTEHVEQEVKIKGSRGRNWLSHFGLPAKLIERIYG